MRARRLYGMDEPPAALARRAVTAVLLVVAALLAVALASGTLSLVGLSAGGSAPGGAPAAGTPGGSASALPDRASAVDRGEVLAGLLERRGSAVLRRDRAGWLATVDPRARAFRGRQAQLFERLLALRPTDWTYRLEDEGAALPARRRAALGASARLLNVTLTYRLPGDTRDVEREQVLTAVQRGGRWYLAADTDGRTERDLWDLGPVRVVRGQRALVVGAAARASTLPRIADDADAAVARVDSVWGRRWPRTVVVVVPGTLQQLAVLLGRKDVAGLDQVAAVTSGELQRGGRVPPGVADRVLLNPVAFADFSALGRRVVLTHEFTHVATRASAIVAPPLWVEEGFADYVGYLRSGLSPSVVAADLVAQVRSGRSPARLPDEDSFDPTNGEIAPAYASSWLAMELMARDGGTRRVVDFYRVAAGLPASGEGRRGGPAGSSDEALRRAFAQVLRESRTSFERRWRGYLRTVASSAR